MSFKYERFLIQAIEQFQLPRIMTCIKHGHNIHVENNLGQNLLVHLLKQPISRDPTFGKKRLQIFQFLIKQCNLSIDTVDHFGKNLFNWAANLNCTEEALYLLNSFPGDINILIRDQSGLCSLHYAIEHGNEQLVQAIVDYLLQYRIRFDIEDNHQNTPNELAKKLGYERIADYLAETSRSTVFMSRKPSFFHYRPLTNKSKTTILTSGLSVSASSISDVSEFHQVMETKIAAAKNLNDWKTVASLRRYQINPNGKKFHQFRKFIYFSFINFLFLFLATPAPQVQKISTTPSPIPFKFLPIKITSSFGGQSQHMLHLLEPQICSSYRQPFVPYYERPILPSIANASTAMGQRKMSITSSRRMSSVLGNRKRDSNASQLGGLLGSENHSRLSLPPVYKQHRPSIVQTRASDTEVLAKLRDRNLISTQN